MDHEDVQVMLTFMPRLNERPRPVYVKMYTKSPLNQVEKNNLLVYFLNSNFIQVKDGPDEEVYLISTSLIRTAEVI